MGEPLLLSDVWYSCYRSTVLSGTVPRYGTVRCCCCGSYGRVAWLFPFLQLVESRPGGKELTDSQQTG